MSDKVIAVIPCYREASWIGGVVKETLPFVDSVIVADDNSDDKTAEIAREAGAQVVTPTPDTRHGVGSNTWCGIYHALAQGADIVVTLDGDGQHDPTDIPVLVRAIQNGADMALGSRFRSGAVTMPMANRLANRILITAGNIGLPQDKQVSDSQCGFRAFRKEALQNIRVCEPGYEFIMEVLVKARKAGLVIVERPVRCNYHQGRPTHSFLGQTVRGVKLLTHIALWRIWERYGI